MPRAKHPLVVFAVLTALGYAAGTAYFPKSCLKTCQPGDFINLLPEVSVDDSWNRPYFWTSVALIHTRENLQHLSPPGIGRIAGIVTSCLYEAAAMTNKELESSLTSPYSFAVAGGGEEVLTAVMDGAGFWAVRAIFGQRDSFPAVHEVYDKLGYVDLYDIIHRINSSPGTSVSHFAHSAKGAGHGRQSAAVLGAKACQLVIDQYTADGFAPDGTLGDKQDPTTYELKNKPQRLAGITDCDNELTDIGTWQPLCIPSSTAVFGTTKCTPQTFLAPFAGRFTTFALEGGDETTGATLGVAPPTVGSAQYEAEWREILKFSAELDDVGKIIAEYWADGPDSTSPAGHWLKIAADAALYEELDQTETARLLFAVGTASNDAGVASWRMKFTYDYSRPLQMIQCGADRGKMMMAWRGPYMGVGEANVSEWRPYQASDFVTPAFAAYVSGHSAFSAAAAEALRLFFDNDKYRGPPCYRVKEGESLFEPISDTMKGISDKPNTGADTMGYVPREDVVLCWDTYTDAADQAGVSRFYGGIHVRADDVIGQKVGRKVGRAAFLKVQALKRSISRGRRYKRG